MSVFLHPLPFISHPFFVFFLQPLSSCLSFYTPSLLPVFFHPIVCLFTPHCLSFLFPFLVVLLLLVYLFLHPCLSFFTLLLSLHNPFCLFPPPCLSPSAPLPVILHPPFCLSFPSPLPASLLPLACLIMPPSCLFTAPCLYCISGTHLTVFLCSQLPVFFAPPCLSFYSSFLPAVSITLPVFLLPP